MNDPQIKLNSNQQEKIDLEITRVINNIEDLDKYIKERTNEDNEQIKRYSNTDFIVDNIKIVKKYLDKYSLKAKTKILDELKKLHTNLIGIKNHLGASNQRDNLSYYYGPLSESMELSDYFQRQEFRTDITLSETEIDDFITEIKLHYPTILIPVVILEKYYRYSEDQKQIISSKLIYLRNEVVKPKNESTEELVENIARNLDFTISNIELEDKLKKIDNTYEILEQVNSQESIKSIKAIESGYKEEAKKLYLPIFILNIAIILIFILIISVISLKFYAYFYQVINTNYKPEGLIQFLNKIGKSPADFIFFFSLLFSISALETYLIKERNRLIKLRDYFLFCDLELTSMPQYMRELNLDQRQNLYIDLSSNYFKGGTHDNNKEIANTEDVSSVLKKIEELSKIIKELKN
ncbi:hypothetical protein LDX65_05400 [Acinetobacter baumannii]|uniref:hypothetical protein n=1 Tax=Acinetobacter baumannii TaxID=470 RepID=UPI001CDD1095|nr:hypothetical protein [Acinetobacter baumannii]MCA4302703.1 hypothetical protein [Acinetobacter baumannii]